MTPDFINGLFEFTGSILLWMNVRALYRDKQVKGVRWFSTAFFAAWGFWNLWYYPSLDQWWSFLGGVSITIANSVWLGQMLYYSRRRGFKPLLRQPQLYMQTGNAAKVYPGNSDLVTYPDNSDLVVTWSDE